MQLIRAIRARATALIVGVVVGALVATGIAWAAIPSTTTTQITACYTKSAALKTLRVIDYPTQRCTTAEAMLTWQSQGLHWRGTYSSTTVYNPNDVVAFGGASCVATHAMVGHAPPTTPWALMAARGLTGATGATGPQGAKGEPARAPISPAQAARLAWFSGVNATVAVPNPVGIAYDGTNLWVSSGAAGHLIRLDPSTNTVTATIPVGTSPGAVAFDGTDIWVTLGTDNVAKIDPSTNSVVATVPVGATPYALAFDGSSMWVSEFQKQPVSRSSEIDPSHRTL